MFQYASSRTDLRSPYPVWIGQDRQALSSTTTCISNKHIYSAAAVTLGLRSIGICFPSLFWQVFRSWGREFTTQMQGFLSGNWMVSEKSQESRAVLPAGREEKQSRPYPTAQPAHGCKQQLTEPPLQSHLTSLYITTVLCTTNNQDKDQGRSV